MSGFSLTAKRTCLGVSLKLIRPSFNLLTNDGYSVTNVENFHRRRNRSSQSHIINVTRLLSSQPHDSKVNSRSMIITRFQSVYSVNQNMDWSVLILRCLLTGARFCNMGTSTRGSTSAGNALMMLG